MDTFSKIYSDPLLRSVIDRLYKGFVNKNFLLPEIEIPFNELRKAGWLATILSQSPHEEHLEKAQRFALLLHLKNNSNKEYDKLSYVILSRLGNLLSTKFFTSLHQAQEAGNTDDLLYEFGTVLDIEVAEERNRQTIEVNGKKLLTTNFQLALWNSLMRESKISISGPTSSGKSFILQNYISTIVSSSQKFHGLYIVPSRALINQAADSLRKNLLEIVVRTSYVDRNLGNENGDGVVAIGDEPSKIIYVLTPERCLKLLQSIDDSMFLPDIIFIDEIQNVEDEHGRGALLEYILEEIALRWNKSKIITAGPFLKNNSALFSSLLKFQNVSVTTNLSPTLQVKAIIRNRADDNTINLAFADSDNEYQEIQIPVNFSLNNFLKKNKGQAVAHVVNYFGAKDQSLIYCPKTNLAEKWALEYAKLKVDLADSANLKELIEFLSEEIHPKYYLIACLQKQIAFHHSRLPDIVRIEIEDLYIEGEIQAIYCTSTLLQGVNLPADNLFVASPTKKTSRLTPFEFGNLIGRAGRVSNSLYGYIYCIEDNDEEKKWAEQFYSTSYDKEVIPSTTRSINTKYDALLNNLTKASIDIKDDAVNYTLTTLRRKFLNDVKDFEKYLNTKEVDKEKITFLSSTFSAHLQNITIPPYLLNLNPTVDPVLQNRLYESIKQDGIESWVIVPTLIFISVLEETFYISILIANSAFIGN